MCVCVCVCVCEGGSYTQTLRRVVCMCTHPNPFFQLSFTLHFIHSSHFFLPPSPFTTTGALFHASPKDYHASATTEFMFQQLAHHRVDLCTQTTCDGGLYERLMGTGNHWKNMGTSMPVFFFEQYSLALVESVKFLEKENVTYSIFAGGTLGFLKFNGLLPWDTGDVDIQVDPESVGGCDAWLSMLKAWADGRGFIHPHVAAACTKEDGPNCGMARGVSNGTGDGANCVHYGVYVGVSKGTNVADPFSMGLTTFTKYAHNEIEPTAQFRAYGMTMRVPVNMGKYNMREYGSTALQHISSVSTKPDADADNHHYMNCKAPSKFRHNCVGLVDGTQTPTCLAHTPFADGGPRAVAAAFGGRAVDAEILAHGGE